MISTGEGMLILDLLHRVGFSDAGIFLAVRIVTFVSLFALLPLPMVPRSARLALGFALFIFLLPVVDGVGRSSTGFVDVLVGIERVDGPLAAAGIRYSSLLFQVATGVALAVALSAGAYAAEALATWSGTLLGIQVSAVRSAFGQAQGCNPKRIVLLLYLAVLAPSLHLLFPALAESIVVVAPLDVTTQLRGVGVTSVTAGIIAGTVRVALLGALIGAVPLFLVALLADLFCGVTAKLFPSAMSVGFWRAVRMLAVIGGISIVSVGTERALASVLNGGLTSDRAFATSSQLQQLDVRPPL